ncbi:hypothetical protein WAF17_01195 [Bernardetia sp. ABR2-2B]|uniref:RHS repeat domain-containing protein n=1 Tax=Bernardetia sp. ABR2-2B TaxID=3127472 RepID=UPI0030CB59EF
MKISFLAILLFLISTNFAFSQDYPVRNDSSLIKKHRIRSISTIFNSISEAERYDSMEVGKVEFDKNGNILREKYFRLFDVMLYSQEYTYKYDKKGRLIEEIENYKDQPQNKEDSAKLNFLGYTDRTSKLTYKYDKENRLIETLEFLKKEDKEPSLSTKFEYNDKGNKIKAIFKHLNAPQQTSLNNRIENYKYDENNNLIETKMTWTTTETASTTTYLYDSLGNMISESTLHYNGRENKRLFFYENGKLKRRETHNLGNEDYNTKKEYEYSEDGCLIQCKSTYGKNGERQSIITFDCNKKGILSSEYWYKDSSTKQKAFSFETTYTYFE